MLKKQRFSTQENHLNKAQVSSDRSFQKRHLFCLTVLLSTLFCGLSSSYASIQIKPLQAQTFRNQDTTICLDAKTKICGLIKYSINSETNCNYEIKLKKDHLTISPKNDFEGEIKLKYRAQIQEIMSDWSAITVNILRRSPEVYHLNSTALENQDVPIYLNVHNPDDAKLKFKSLSGKGSVQYFELHSTFKVLAYRPPCNFVGLDILSFRLDDNCFKCENKSNVGVLVVNVLPKSEVKKNFEDICLRNLTVDCDLKVNGKILGQEIYSNIIHSNVVQAKCEIDTSFLKTCNLQAEEIHSKEGFIQDINSCNVATNHLNAKQIQSNCITVNDDVRIKNDLFVGKIHQTCSVEPIKECPSPKESCSSSSSAARSSCHSKRDKKRASSQNHSGLENKLKELKCLITNYSPEKKCDLNKSRNKYKI